MSYKPPYKQFHNVADRQVNPIKKEIINLIEGIRSKANFKKIEAEIEKHGINYLENVIDWNHIDDEINMILTGVLTQCVENSGNLATKYFPKQIKKAGPKIGFEGIKVEFEFNTNNPRIKEHIKNRVAEMRLTMTNGGAGVIEKAIKLNLNRGYNAKQIARMIRPSIGLTERQSTAVMNLANKLYGEGIAEHKIQTQLDRYANKLLNYRAENIARTETMTAMNCGQSEMWRQAGEMGLFEYKKATKTWDVVPDDALCEFCDIMDGQEVGLEEEFDGGDMDNVFEPPLHNSCRCMQIINFND